MSSDITDRRIRAFIDKHEIDQLLSGDLKNYVYALYSPGERFPFYVGKGVGGRVLNHFGEAIRELSKTDSEAGSSDKLKAILQAFKDGSLEPEIRIIRRNLDEAQVRAVEGALIDALEPAGNKVRGLHSVDDGMITLNDLIIEKGAKPVSPSVDYPMIYLYNIEKGFKKFQCYDRALRGDWKSNRHMTDLPKFQAGGCKAFAVGLVQGISRFVIEVQSWEPSPDGEKRFKMVGPAQSKSELLHRKWTQMIQNSGYWKWGRGLILGISTENGVPQFRIISGDSKKQFQPIIQ
jgi:hypothetical protein